MKRTIAKPPKPASSVDSKTQYDRQYDLYLWTLEKQFDYGKWVLVSILAAHTVLLVASMSSSATTASKSSLPLVIGGIGAVLLAGALAWLNLFISANINSAIIDDIEKSRAGYTDLRETCADLAFWSALAAAFVSLGFFIWAGIRTAGIA
ncbi:hypothetical protein GFL85_18530 [Rhizobium laguerreae]|uniref:hypothetical protein n=1 Tax=Rhizobium laguerreae TaxID=1076926 RepID=UPI00143F5A4B|nr:hypothetical protein [Rhizobium laguerreae]NKM13002.1 hypothetical protein [Rhizobium laguerreae]